MTFEIIFIIALVGLQIYVFTNVFLKIKSYQKFVHRGRRVFISIPLRSPERLIRENKYGTGGLSPKLQRQMKSRRRRVSLFIVIPSGGARAEAPKRARENAKSRHAE